MKPTMGVFVLLWSVSGVNADPMIHRGDRELSASGSLDFLGPTGDTLNLSAGFGMFPQDNIVLRASILLSTVEDIAPGENDYRMREVDLGAEYHFDLGRGLVPYVGAEFGWRRSKFGSADESALVYGPRAGLKYFIADNVAIDLALAYKLSSKDVFVSDFEARDDYMSFTFGLRVMF